MLVGAADGDEEHLGAEVKRLALRGGSGDVDAADVGGDVLDLGAGTHIDLALAEGALQLGAEVGVFEGQQARQ